MTHRIKAHEWMLLAMAAMIISAVFAVASRTEPSCSSATPYGDASYSICKAFNGG